jgi:hypothetical protein
MSLIALQLSDLIGKFIPVAPSDCCSGAMDEMLKHPRLIRRGATFWHRAAVPRDIAGTYGKIEETFSLRTKNPKEP